MTRLIFKVVPFLLTFSQACGLECYACAEQPENTDKCIKTVIQCLEHEDVCFNEVTREIDDWTPTIEWLYIINKGCDTQTNCEQRKHALMKQCKRDFFNRWSCLECCHGDKCNYYITTGSSAVNPTMFLLLTTVLASALAFI